MTTPWALPDFDAHEGVHFVTDRATGLRAIIAVHSTHRGPAAGGTRFWHYPDPGQALTDVLRLSRGMSYKNAMAGLAMGGGKAVILADDDGTKTPDMLRAFGRAVEGLAGHYVTAEDVGMSVENLVTIAQETRFVSGLPVASGAVGGDPGPHTARGVFLGIQAAVRRALGKENLSGLRVAIQGVGSVGSGVARRAAAEGARLVLADVNAERARALAAELGGEAIDAADVLTLEADVVSPNALGAILAPDSIAALRTPVVAGGANNQLATPDCGVLLQQRGILYAPDYVINAGGIINVASEYLGDADQAGVDAKIDAIPVRLEAIWSQAEASGRDPAAVADAMARELIGR